MRRAYMIVGTALCVVGLYFVVDDLLASNAFFRGVGVLGGLAVLFVGVFNLLNYSYGRAVHVLRTTAAVASALLFAAIMWLTWANWGWRDTLAATLLAVAAALSLVSTVGSAAAARDGAPPN